MENQNTQPNAQTMPRPAAPAPQAGMPPSQPPAAPPPLPPAKPGMALPIVLSLIFALIAGGGAFAAAWFMIPGMVADDLAATQERINSKVADTEERINSQIQTMNDNLAVLESEILGQVDDKLENLTIAVGPTQPPTYRNLDFGYTMEFPETWSGYSVTPLAGTLAGQEIGGITVGLPGAGTMFMIRVYEPEDWQTLRAQDGPKPVEITSDDSYVYTWERPSDTMSGFEDRAAEIPSIIRSFTLTSG